MSTTATDSIALGTSFPQFSLLDVLTGTHVTSDKLTATCSKGILVIFLCRHCPYVQHVQPELIDLASCFMPQGIAFLGICSKDAITYPEDAPPSLREMIIKEHIPFPILYDETQEVAKMFSATCTPDFFLFNSSSQLTYHARFDASTPRNNVPVSGDDLRCALEAVVRGEAVRASSYPSIGCSIKWKE